MVVLIQSLREEFSHDHSEMYPWTDRGLRSSSCPRQIEAAANTSTTRHVRQEIVKRKAESNAFPRGVSCCGRGVGHRRDDKSVVVGKQVGNQG